MKDWMDSVGWVYMKDWMDRIGWIGLDGYI